MLFSLIRNGLTATSVSMDVKAMGGLHRWILSSIRHSGGEAGKYHFIAYADIGDISGTDLLEEITGGAPGITFNIVNKRIYRESHMEFDMEPLEAYGTTGI